ncbi:MAG: nickel transporter [Methanomicrobiales archaeon]|nr:nickel transporter [Methanomicrobiales archaeon]
MDLYLATDLKSGLIVHGKSGMRESYVPVTSIHADTSEPLRFIEQVKPKNLYIADLDRICGTGDHDNLIPYFAERTEMLLVDRGCRSPDDMLTIAGMKNIVGTETAGEILDQFTGGVLSVDIKKDLVIPWNTDPILFLSSCHRFQFEMIILLDIGRVGTGLGLSREMLTSYRLAYPGALLWGGGVSSEDDLILLTEVGFDGAIIATAIHTGRIPVEYIRRGSFCL